MKKLVLTIGLFLNGVVFSQVPKGMNHYKITSDTTLIIGEKIGYITPQVHPKYIEYIYILENTPENCKLVIEEAIRILDKYDLYLDTPTINHNPRPYWDALNSPIHKDSMRYDLISKSTSENWGTGFVMREWVLPINEEKYFTLHLTIYRTHCNISVARADLMIEYLNKNNISPKSGVGL